jgi:nucleoside-diphosphate-sugar epimerase
LKDVMGAYRISKVKAEKAAWEWAKNNQDVEVVAINPTFVVGPVLPPVDTKDFKFQPRPQPLGTSCDTFRKFLQGEIKTANKFNLGWIDVRDVALMHILAAERPKAAGQRYIGSAIALSQYEAIEILKSKFPEFNIEVAEGANGPHYEVSYQNFGSLTSF